MALWHRDPHPFPSVKESAKLHFRVQRIGFLGHKDPSRTAWVRCSKPRLCSSFTRFHIGCEVKFAGWWRKNWGQGSNSNVSRVQIQVSGLTRSVFTQLLEFWGLASTAPGSLEIMAGEAASTGVGGATGKIAHYERELPLSTAARSGRVTSAQRAPINSWPHLNADPDSTNTVFLPAHFKLFQPA